MGIEMRRMLRRLAAATAPIAVAFAITGCSGSGSSGLDIAPANEATAISQAIDGDQCVPFGQQTFCASGVPAETENFQGAAVVIHAPDEPLVCSTDNASGTKDCAASLAFTTEGFTTQSSLLAAVSDDEKGPWKLVPLTVSEDVAGPRTVTIVVPGRTNADGLKPLIAAVLVYAGPAPDEPSRTAVHLEDFGAEVVYVSPRLVIVIP